MAEMIGSDVPFFIFQSAAVCKGRGELVSPTRLREQLSVLLLKPEFGVPTQWAYSRWRDSREIPGVSYGAQQFTQQSFVNDLERPVFEKFVFLAQLKMWLLKQPEVGAALMSGSGSTVFAVIRDQCRCRSLAMRAKAELDPELWTCACAHGSAMTFSSRGEAAASPQFRASYSPSRWRNCARAYSRLSFAMKLALILAGHTASHS